MDHCSSLIPEGQKILRWYIEQYWYFMRIIHDHLAERFLAWISFTPCVFAWPQYCPSDNLSGSTVSVGPEEQNHPPPRCCDGSGVPQARRTSTADVIPPPTWCLQKGEGTFRKDEIEMSMHEVTCIRFPKHSWPCKNVRYAWHRSLVVVPRYGV